MLQCFDPVCIQRQHGERLEHDPGYRSYRVPVVRRIQFSAVVGIVLPDVDYLQSQTPGQQQRITEQSDRIGRKNARKGASRNWKRIVQIAADESRIQEIDLDGVVQIGREPGVSRSIAEVERVPIGLPHHIPAKIDFVRHDAAQFDSKPRFDRLIVVRSRNDQGIPVGRPRRRVQDRDAAIDAIFAPVARPGFCVN